MFSHEEIVQFKNKVNKRDFYRQFLELRQSGKLLWAKCCFHNDHELEIILLFYLLCILH